MTILASYACSSDREHEADARIECLPHSITPHIVTVDPFNHATARNGGLAYARDIRADWLVWMDADWILDTCHLVGNQILQGRIHRYPHADSPWRRASVFAVPRAVFERVPLWDDEHFTTHWADIHWAIVLCKRSGLRIAQTTSLRVEHIPHPIKPPGREWHRAKAFYEADKIKDSKLARQR